MNCLFFGYRWKHDKPLDTSTKNKINYLLSESIRLRNDNVSEWGKDTASADGDGESMYEYGDMAIFNKRLNVYYRA